MESIFAHVAGVVAIFAVTIYVMRETKRLLRAVRIYRVTPSKPETDFQRKLELRFQAMGATFVDTCEEANILLHLVKTNRDRLDYRSSYNGKYCPRISEEATNREIRMEISIFAERANNYEKYFAHSQDQPALRLLK